MRGITAPLGPGDVDAIARRQVALEDDAAERARQARAPLVVRDTDLVSTVVYARHYYGACPRWIEEAARARRAALYLLCDVDVPWKPDPVQRDGSGADPRERAVIRDVFGAVLGEFGCTWRWVRGGWSERAHTAAEAVRALTGTLPGATGVRTAGAP